MAKAVLGKRGEKNDFVAQVSYHLHPFHSASLGSTRVPFSLSLSLSLSLSHQKGFRIESEVTLEVCVSPRLILKE